MERPPARVPELPARDARPATERAALEIGEMTGKYHVQEDRGGGSVSGGGYLLPRRPLQAARLCGSVAGPGRGPPRRERAWLGRGRARQCGDPRPRSSEIGGEEIASAGSSASRLFRPFGGRRGGRPAG